MQAHTKSSAHPVVGRLERAKSVIKHRPRGFVSESIYPVVQLEAFFGNQPHGAGAGFLVQPWGSSIVTARHVIMGPSGASPTSVRVTAWTGDEDTELSALGFSFFPPQGGDFPDAEVAVLRIEGAFASRLRRSTLVAPAALTVRGYRIGVDFTTRGFLDSPWVRLEDGGLPGMSGGPVALVPPDGEEPTEVVGIYFGVRNGPGGRALAYSVDAPALAACEASLDQAGTT